MGDEDLERIWTLGELIDRLAESAPRSDPRPRPELVLEGRPADRFWLRPARGTWPAVQFCRTVGGPFFRALLGGYERVGTDRIDWDERPLIIASNHQTHLDAILLARALPAGVHRHLFFLGYTGYFGQGWGRWVGRLFRICPVSPDRRILSGMRTAVAAIRKGRILGIFPEGERTWTGAVQRFRRGVAWIARHTGARVVPAAVTGGYQAWPRGWGFTPHPYRIEFGPPIDPPREEGRAAEERFLARLHERISELVRRAGHDPVRGDPLVFALGPREARRQRDRSRRREPGVRA